LCRRNCLRAGLYFFTAVTCLTLNDR
jgi:hypothetical protein